MRLSVPTLLLCLVAFIALPASAQQQQSSYGFLSFSGRSSVQNAEINWETIQELTITHFNVQYSTNGIDFTTAGRVDARYDTAMARNQYHFTDFNAARRGKLLYYRLQIAINNGRMLYSPLSVLRFSDGQSSQLALSTNVVRGTLSLFLENTTDAGAQLSIIDAQGRMLQTQKIQLVKGMFQQDVDVSGLPQGHFVVVVMAQGIRLQQRFFHQ
jgi:hypothetical protein